jgi:hypothetical protein
MSAEFVDAARGDVDGAVVRLRTAQAVYSTNVEPSAWAAVLLARAGRLDEAASYAAHARRVHPGWATFWSRLPDADLLPDDPDVLRALLAGVNDDTAC